MTLTANESKPTDKQFYDYIVDHLKREHGLAGNRMGWMLTSQAFLFAAFGAVNSANFKPLNPAHTGALNVAIPTVGLTVSIAILLGVLGTNMAVRVYRKEWAAKPDAVTRFPPTSGWGVPHGLGLFSTLIIPLVVCFSWLLVLKPSENKCWLLLFGIVAVVILSAYVIWDARDPTTSSREESQLRKVDRSGTR